ncbi:hypothetical protein [uncultured Allobaculum sp.]|uniref:hypothetical protein n=1 Tax=uncultured Allobaculum sp. TaxID=1187017 RepID=UPI00258F1D5B|nr:hypothetical protein [uncultured Allobaculum sp.]
MMDPVITSAIIAASIPAIASIVVNLIANSKTSALMKYRLDVLEKKQDKHNQLIERVYHLEEGQKVQDEKIRVANHRIDDLEKTTG